MKVVHIEEWFHPDMGYQVNFFARFHNPAIEFFIVTAETLDLWGNPYTREQLAERDKIFEEKNNVTIIRLPVKFNKKGRQNVWLCDLFKTIYSIHPDIVYVHGLETYSSFRIFLKKEFLKNFKVVVDTHTLHNQFLPGIKTKIYIWLIKFFIIRRINKYKIRTFYTATENQNILIQVYGIAPELIKSCLIGTDTTIYYYSEKDRYKLRNTLAISENSNVLLYVGKFNYTKQPHLIIKAIKLVEKSIIRQLCIVLVGSRNNNYVEEYLHDSFSNKQIELKIIPAVENTELYKYYSMADFAVFPKENTLSSLDAQACKLPLIMEDDDTNRERLKKGGFLYQKNNLDDLAEKILLCINSPQSLDEMGQEGYSYIIQHYDYRNIINEMEKHLFSIVS